jgi:hypothetical protein
MMLLNKMCCVDENELGWDPDDWVVILSYEMWDIRGVNRVYVYNLGPTSIGETLPKFW